MSVRSQSILLNRLMIFAMEIYQEYLERASRTILEVAEIAIEA